MFKEKLKSVNPFQRYQHFKMVAKVILQKYKNHITLAIVQANMAKKGHFLLDVLGLRLFVEVM